MARGRTDSNLPLRERRATGGRVFHGNSTVVARACDRFLVERGILVDGLRGLMTRQIRDHKAGRTLREDKIDRAATDLEQSWQA
jgi:hypothetical protein